MTGVSSHDCRFSSTMWSMRVSINNTDITKRVLHAAITDDIGWGTSATCKTHSASSLGQGVISRLPTHCASKKCWHYKFRTDFQQEATAHTSRKAWLASFVCVLSLLQQTTSTHGSFPTRYKRRRRRKSMTVINTYYTVVANEIEKNCFGPRHQKQCICHVPVYGPHEDLYNAIQFFSSSLATTAAHLQLSSHYFEDSSDCHKNFALKSTEIAQNTLLCMLMMIDKRTQILKRRGPYKH